MDELNKLQDEAWELYKQLTVLQLVMFDEDRLRGARVNVSCRWIEDAKTQMKYGR